MRPRFARARSRQGRALHLLPVLALACGGGRSVGTQKPDPELSPALAPLAWWLGDWQGEGSREHWIAVSGALYGIAFTGDGFEVMIVDDGDGGGPPDGVLRFYAMPGGAKSVEFKQDKLDATSARFANPEHDDPKVITYAREGDNLVAKLEGDKPLTFSFVRGRRQRAPELEAADRAFSADTGERGIEGWMAAFEPDGGMIRKGARVSGETIREMMAPLLGAGKLAWEPVASGKAGKLGFTVGKATYTGADNWESSYVTIWRQQADGTWKVWFDTGRPVQK